MGEGQNTINEADDDKNLLPGDAEEEKDLQAALHNSLVTHQQHLSVTSGLSGVSLPEQIKRLNAELLPFLRLIVDVPDSGNCWFEALVHLWNAEVCGEIGPEAPEAGGEIGPEAPWIAPARAKAH